jgi:hypothetical protein
LYSMNRRLGQIEMELRNLFEMRIAGQILPIDGNNPQEVYEEYKSKKEAEKYSIQNKVKKLQLDDQEWKNKASNFFEDCCNAKYKFLHAEEEKQYLFLNRITSNVFLDEKKLIVTHKIPFTYLLKSDSHPNLLPRQDSDLEPSS